MRWTIGKYDGYRLYLISCMDRYSVYLTYTLQFGGEDLGDIPHNDPRASSQTLSCNKHDICFQTCGEDRGICDSALYDDARKECENHYPDDCTSTLSTEECKKYHLEAGKCELAAIFMYEFILPPASEEPWEERQVQHCYCCKN